jgi:tRNA1Val (adenine37-N6)-methyltransferase
MKSELTNDTFLNGRLKIKQSKLGYRFSIDAILLANHIQFKSSERILDIGTGCGVIPLILALRYPDVKIFGIDIQQQLLDIALLNISENHMKDRITVFNCDVKNLTPSMTSGPVDVVVCNPPHREPNSGRINPNHQLAIARHEIAMTIDDLIQAGKRLLDGKGRFIVIYPANRVMDILKRIHAAKIEPKKLWMIHSKSNNNAIRCIVEGIKGGKPGMTVGPPLIIYNEDGSYAEIIKNMFSPCANK